MLLPYMQPNIIEAGVDEAGRGCFAGPVFAAAVILPPTFYHPLLNDSKQVSEKNRAILRTIIETECIAFGVAAVNNNEIDKINILQASFKAMHKAIQKIKHPIDVLLIDGNRFQPYKKTPGICVVKGDGKYASIAAASILAKTYRDEYMQNLHPHFMAYEWNKNKGYGTAAHRLAIEKYGLTQHHRKSFRIMPLAKNEL